MFTFGRFLSKTVDYFHLDDIRVELTQKLSFHPHLIMALAMAYMPQSQGSSINLVPLLCVAGTDKKVHLYLQTNGSVILFNPVSTLFIITGTR